MEINPTGNKLTLDVPTIYEIVVSGNMEGDWSDWIAESTRIEQTCGQPNATTITGVFDQAALHGTLRRLYSLGFPLISVSWIRTPVSAEEEK
jgi:hypothetical protein